MLRTFRDASVFIEIFDLNVYMRFRSRWYNVISPVIPRSYGRLHYNPHLSQWALARTLKHHPGYADHVDRFWICTLSPKLARPLVSYKLILYNGYLSVFCFIIFIILYLWVVSGPPLTSQKMICGYSSVLYNCSICVRVMSNPEGIPIFSPLLGKGIPIFSPLLGYLDKRSIVNQGRSLGTDPIYLIGIPAGPFEFNQSLTGGHICNQHHNTGNHCRWRVNRAKIYMQCHHAVAISHLATAWWWHTENFRH